MKQTVLIILAAMALLMASSSCKDQKPTERPNVWAEDTSNVKMSEKKVQVPFKRLENGLAEVQVSMNGVPFNMWWDTGASATCISMLELQKLVKENKIEEDDILGVSTAKLADGMTTDEQPVFNIKEIFIQGQDRDHYLVLHDVAAIVTLNLEAPLLLGQNVISQLPKHSFNESTGMIEFDQE